jgi:hypothetical protein
MARIVRDKPEQDNKICDDRDRGQTECRLSAIVPFNVCRREGRDWS